MAVRWRRRGGLRAASIALRILGGAGLRPGTEESLVFSARDARGNDVCGLWCWGGNVHGELGSHSQDFRSITPVRVVDQP